jgi:hypothetical protein
MKRAMFSDCNGIDAEMLKHLITSKFICCLGCAAGCFFRNTKIRKVTKHDKHFVSLSNCCVQKVLIIAAHLCG